MNRMLWDFVAAIASYVTTGTIDARRPISVTVIQEDGRTAVFRCAPTGDGRWLPPVARTVAFGGRR